MSQQSYQCPAFDGGHALVRWVAVVSCNCAYGNLSAGSWVLGWVSFCIWLGAQIPQIVENYLNQSVEGVSLFFLLIWFIGDVTNLIGCILTRQLPFQTALALYFIIVDSILLCQYVYYMSRSVPWLHHPHVVVGGNGDPGKADTNTKMVTERSDSVGHQQQCEHDRPETSETLSIPTRRSSSSSLRALITSSFVASFARVHSAPAPNSSDLVVDALQSNISANLMIKSNAQLIGYISAWVCACMYLSSRMPQIYKNFRRKSTWGVSIHLFVAALCGNFTYTLSILFSEESRGPHSRQFLMNELPYLLGSAGTICFDLTVFWQYITYGNKHPQIVLQEASIYSTTKVDSDCAGPSSWRPSQAKPIPSARHMEPDEYTPLAFSLQTNYSN